MLDEYHQDLPKAAGDPNSYVLGSSLGHNVVIACLPSRDTSASHDSIDHAPVLISSTFPSIKLVVFLGIGVGISPDVKGGDVVVSMRKEKIPGVARWEIIQDVDSGGCIKSNFGSIRGLFTFQDSPDDVIQGLTNISSPEAVARSKLPEFLRKVKNEWAKTAAEYLTPSICWPATVLGLMEEGKLPSRIGIHTGLVATGQDIRHDARVQRQLASHFGHKLLCADHELSKVFIEFPCVVVHGIHDTVHCDASGTGQALAMALAAAGAREILTYIQPELIRPAHTVAQSLNRTGQSPSMFSIVIRY